jgi:Glycosyltransferase family 87
MKFNRWLCLGLSVLLIIFSSYFTMRYVAENERADIWCNAIGSRVLVEKHESPYFFKWDNSTEERYVDPTDDNMHPVSRVTFTPIFAILFYPFAIMDMWYMKWAFYFFNLLLLVWVIFGAVRHRTTNEMVTNLLFFSIFMLNSSAWWWQCADGQKYVFFLFVLVLFYRALQVKKYGLAGVVAIIAVIFYCYLLEKKNRISFTKGAFVGLLLVFAMHSVWLDWSIWKDYFSAMHLWSIYGLNEMPVLAEFAINPIAKDVNGISFPFDDALRHNNSGIQRWLYKISGLKVYKEFLFATYAAVALLLAKMWSTKALQKSSPDVVFLQFFLIYVLSEYFIPAARLPYYYVQWFFPILLIYNKVGFGKGLFKVLFITGLSLNTIFLSFIPYGQIIGELFLIVSLLMFLYMQSDEYTQKYPIVSEI